MNKRLIHLIFLLTALLPLTACQKNIEANTALPDAVVEDTGYPPPEIYIPMGEFSYPIDEESLLWLLRSWQLNAVAEDGIFTDPPSKTLVFYADGSYDLITDTETSSGAWSTDISDEGNLLHLKPGTDQTMAYEIISLNEYQLILSTTREGVQVEEQYFAAE